MIRTKGISLLIPLLFLAMVALILAAPREDAFSQIQFQAEDASLTLTPWYQETEEKYYLVLPSFLSKEDLSITHPWYIRCYTDWSEASGDISFRTSFLWGRQRTHSLRLMSCSAGQTICIDAQEGMLSYLHADQDHAQKVFVTFWDDSGQQEYAGKTTISGRGNSTWEWEKKPYNLDFSNPVTLGPFEEVSKLCLFAEYYDLSKLRNAAAYHTGQVLDIPYASPYTYADLFVNGEYLGLYAMATKTEYRKHLTSDGITAVFELSTSGKGTEFTSDSGKTIRVYYGDEALIQYKVESMEKALKARDLDTLEQHMDLDSWAKKYAMDELFYNYDLSLTSEYFYLDGGGKIRCMLPWDYEWILYPRMYPYTMASEQALCAYYNLPNWYSSLLELEPFRASVREAYDSVYTEDFLQDLNAYLTRCEGELRDSYYADQLRWQDAYAVSHHLTPGSAGLSGQADFFTRGLSQRLAFLKELFHNWDEYCLVTFWTEIDGQVTPFNLQLILPKGDFTAYHEAISQSLYPPTGYSYSGPYTEDGIAMEEILTLTENTALYLHCLPEESEVNHDNP